MAISRNILNILRISKCTFGGGGVGGWTFLLYLKFVKLFFLCIMFYITGKSVEHLANLYITQLSSSIRVIESNLGNSLRSKLGKSSSDCFRDFF